MELLRVDEGDPVGRWGPGGGLGQAVNPTPGRMIGLPDSDSMSFRRIRVPLRGQVLAPSGGLAIMARTHARILEPLGDELMLYKTYGQTGKDISAVSFGGSDTR